MQWQRVKKTQVTIVLTPLMEYDDLWPFCSHQSQPLLTKLKNQLTLSHNNPKEKVKTGLGSVSMLAPFLCSQCGGNECDVWWLSDWQETLLSLGLSDCLQRKWRKAWRTERPLQWYCVQLLLVSCRFSCNQIKINPVLHSPTSSHKIIISCVTSNQQSNLLIRTLKYPWESEMTERGHTSVYQKRCLALSQSTLLSFTSILQVRLKFHKPKTARIMRLDAGSECQTFPPFQISLAPFLPYLPSSLSSLSRPLCSPLYCWSCCWCGCCSRHKLSQELWVCFLQLSTGTPQCKQTETWLT